MKKNDNLFSPLRERIQSKDDIWEHIDAIITGECRILENKLLPNLHTLKIHCRAVIAEAYEQLGKSISFSYIRQRIRQTCFEWLENHENEQQQEQFEIIQLFSGLVPKYLDAKYITADISIDNPQAFVDTALRNYICQGLQLSPDKAFQSIDFHWFTKHKLKKILYIVYDNDVYQALLSIFSDSISLPYKRNHLPQGFWLHDKDLSRTKTALEWFKKHYNIQSKADIQEYTSEHFSRVGLGGMLQIIFKDSPFLALKSIFPDLLPWEMKQTPPNTYKDHSGRIIALTAFLIENNIGSIIGVSPEIVYERGVRKVVSRKNLEQFGLRGLLARYNNNIHMLFKDCFPEQILPWTLTNGIEHADDPFEFAAEAIRWLFLNYLALDKEDIPQYATERNFKHLGFSGIISNKRLGLNSSPFLAIDLAFPGEFSREEFKKHRDTIKLRHFTKSLQRKT